MLDLEEALKVVRQNGYIPIKITDKMNIDMDRCSECSGDGDCMSCSANICLIERM